MIDPYVYPNKVLINNFNIEDSEKLKIIERTICSIKYSAIIKQTYKIKKTFDFKYLKTIHRELFKDIYSWAGKIRTIDLCKGNTLFCHYPYIDENAKNIFDELKKEDYFHNCKDKNKLCDELAKLFLDINILHPFREGNGRTQRIFIKELARENGYELHWKNIPQNLINTASINDDFKFFSQILNNNMENKKK